MFHRYPGSARLPIVAYHVMWCTSKDHIDPETFVCMSLYWNDWRQSLQRKELKLLFSAPFKNLGREISRLSAVDLKMLIGRIFWNA